MLDADDVRLAVRRLLKQPGITAASVLAMACGIGAAAATWSLLSAVLLRPLPVDAPERLFAVTSRIERPSGPARVSAEFAYPVYQAIRDSGAFEDLAAGGPRSLLVTEPDGLPQQRTIYFASHDFFDALGVRLARGREFEPRDDVRGAPPVAVISDSYWRRILGADPSVLGTVVRVASTPVTIVGVAPPGFRGLNLSEAPDLYLPLHTVGEIGDPNANYFAEPLGTPPVRSSPLLWIRVTGRLPPGATVEDATARLGFLTVEGWDAPLLGLMDVNTAAIPEAARAGMAQFTDLLVITVGLLLLIGCVTVGMLLLVRAEDRRDEFAVCLALGATRVRLARSVALEGTLLSVLGAAFAVPVAGWVFSGVRAFQLPGRVDMALLNLSMDWTAFSIIAGSATVLTALIALVAAAFGVTTPAATALHSRTGSTPPFRRRYARAVLVAAQVAVTLVLALGAGLFARSLIAALSLNPGIDTGRIATVNLSLLPYGYSAPRAAAFFESLRERLSRNQAIESVSITRYEGAMGTGGKVAIDGEPREMPSQLAYMAVDDRYFSTMDLRIVAGRNFSADDTMSSPLVVIVSESFGRLIANGGNPVGHRITETSWRPPDPPAVAEVIGVVPDVITNVNTMAPLVKYYSLAQREPLPHGTVVVRAAGNPQVAVRETASAIRSLDPLVTPGPMLTLDEQIGRQMNTQRFGVYVLGTLGGIALLLTVLGTYVVTSSMAATRRREMTIRAALGASRIRLGTLVLVEAALLVGIGLVAGLGLAAVGATTVGALLYRTEPLDPGTLATVSGVILSLALIVSLRPAIQAARVDLTRALREE